MRQIKRVYVNNIPLLGDSAWAAAELEVDASEARATFLGESSAWSWLPPSIFFLFLSETLGDPARPFIAAGGEDALGAADDDPAALAGSCAPAPVVLEVGMAGLFFKALALTGLVAAGLATLAFLGIKGVLALALVLFLVLDKSGVIPPAAAASSSFLGSFSLSISSESESDESLSYWYVKSNNTPNKYILPFAWNDTVLSTTRLTYTGVGILVIIVIIGLVLLQLPKSLLHGLSGLVESCPVFLVIFILVRVHLRSVLVSRLFVGNGSTR